jgi:protoheme IX farnesyltransferase
MDRDIDALMERTKERPTARGALGAPSAIGLGLGLCLAGEAVLGLAGLVPALVGLAGALVYVLAYTAWAKRRTHLSSFVGGVAGAIPPLIGWAAVDPGLGGPALPLFGLLVIWQQAHVRALGLMREKEYERAGLPLPGLGRDGARGRRRSEASLLSWTALLVPYPLLALAPLGRARVLALSGLALLWLLAGLILRRGDWRRLMFRLSLAWLVLAFAAMLV